MIVGIPKERRPYEYRVGLPPAGVSLFLQHGHRVYVENGAGVGAGFRDQDYGREGAQIAYSAEELFGRADLALKFARPLREELEGMREGAALAGFLHLAAAREDKLQLIAEKQLTALAYELVQEDSGERPIMAPLSQIGGRMAVQIAARLLQNDHGGRGILLGGLAGVPPAEVAVLGAGVAGSTAAASHGRSPPSSSRRARRTTSTRHSGARRRPSSFPVSARRWRTTHRAISAIPRRRTRASTIRPTGAAPPSGAGR